MHTLHQLQETIEKRILQFNFEKVPLELYQPVEYAIGQKGKRLRPVLLLAANEIFSDDIEKAFNPAIGMELFHNFTLIHDDILDHAQIRRGKPTVSKKFGIDNAILSGDVMLIYAYRSMCQIDPFLIKGVLEIFNDTAIKVCEGQQIDLNYEKSEKVSVQEYINMIELKTAVLIAACLKIGAFIGGASQSDCQHLYDFGKNIGIAFQLQDDILDVYGDEALFGKKVGGDILLNKKTFLLIKAMELATGNIKHRLENWLKIKDFNPEEKIEDVITIYNNLDVKSFAMKQKRHYYQNAISALEHVSADRDKKSLLIEISEQLMNRDV